MKRITSHLALLVATGHLLGCGADVGDASAGAYDAPPAAAAPSSGDTAGPGASGVAQPGAQDFGLFRDILARGQIPAPRTLDPMGFFAEHKLDYPAADCGDALCVHGLLGVRGNMINGGDCTLVQIGLNSPLQPETLARPPLDLVLSIDVSGSMRGDALTAVRDGLHQMLDHLDEADTVTLVAYSSDAEVRLSAVTLEDRAALDAAIDGLVPLGNTDLYAGLFTAFEQAEALRAPDRAVRVVLLSDGVATAGLTDPGRLAGLARAYARRGIGVTTIGVGADFDVEVMRGLAEVGAGNFYFLEDPAAVREVFTEEVETFLVPIALDAQVELRVGPGWVVRRAYGTRGWTGGLRGGRADFPVLFLAGRQRAADAIEGGRRGGGGGILVELGRAGGETAATGDEPIGELVLSYTDALTGERRTQRATVENPLPSGALPERGWFTDDTVEKGFVMLNVFVGLQLATELAADADVGTALGVLEALRPQVADWLTDHPDLDIADDMETVGRFITVLRAAAPGVTVRQPPAPWPVD